MGITNDTLTTIEYPHAKPPSGYIAGWGLGGIQRGLQDLERELAYHRKWVADNKKFQEQLSGRPYYVPDVCIARRNDRHPWRFGRDLY